MSYEPYLIAAALFEALIFGWALWTAWREGRRSGAPRS